MGEELRRKRVIVLCDSGGMAGALETELGDLAEISFVHDPVELLVPNGKKASADPDLIVVVSHSIVEAPLVCLAQAGLLHLVGCVPLVVLSRAPFRAIPDLLVNYLPLPGQAGELCQVLRSVLKGAPSPSA